MKTSLLTILISCAALASAVPHQDEQAEEARARAIGIRDAARAAYYAKRQNGDYSDLLQLASIAGIPVPTDNPGLLLSIAPLAASLNALLPTAPVLSVLETAAPSGLISSLVHDPSFAASWISSFEAGPSPAWFLSLPSSVRSYLHTYADGGNLGAAATVVAGIASAESVLASSTAATATATKSSAVASATASGSESESSSSSAATASASASASSSASALVESASSSLSGAASSISSSVSQAGAAAAAARETGVLAAGAAAVVGVLGLAVAL